MAAIVAKLMRTGLRRGLRDGSRGWLYVGMTAAALQIARRIFTEQPETVFTTELKPGQGIEVRTVARHDGGRGKRTRR
ncbi:MAG: hypothetical protein WD598_08780 [Acidimicrobiia bacterium]